MEQLIEELLELARSPAYGPILKRALEYEDRTREKGGWQGEEPKPPTIETLGYDPRSVGWEWHDVNAMPAYLMRLAHAGVVSIVFRSNKHTVYRLTDPELVRKALAGEIVPAQVADEEDNGVALVTALGDLFSPIVGYDDVKDLFFRALHADRPVHVLLEGPPSSAKTLFLMEVARLPRAYFAIGGSTSRAGLTDVLLLYRPRYLLLDEIETIDNARDYTVLLHLMENYEVIETKYRRHNRVPLASRVFAAGNSVSGLPAPLLSRFGGPKGVVRFKEYTAQEFAEISVSLLVKRESVPEAFARKVADAAMSLGTRDVRLAIRLARLAQNEEDLAKVVETMRRRR